MLRAFKGSKYIYLLEIKLEFRDTDAKVLTIFIQISHTQYFIDSDKYLKNHEKIHVFFSACEKICTICVM